VANDEKLELVYQADLLERNKDKVLFPSALERGLAIYSSSNFCPKAAPIKNNRGRKKIEL
jgi:hypothetical protein